jgi:hypothetical protein
MLNERIISLRVGCCHQDCVNVGWKNDLFKSREDTVIRIVLMLNRRIICSRVGC